MTRMKGDWGYVGEVRSPLCLSVSGVNCLYGELKDLDNEKELELANDDL